MGYLRNIDARIRGHDSVYYYIYLRSALFDGDIDFDNELDHFYGTGSARETTPTGLPGNVFSVGPAILWSPFFVLAHLATLLARAAGCSLEANGYSALYQASVYIGNSIYGLIGIFFTALFLKVYLKPAPTLIACLGILFGSQLTYYLWSFTAMSHNVSFAATALFLYLMLTRGADKWTGLAASLMILARWQNALFLIRPLA